MKKVTFIGLLIIGLIFQNCKNNKTPKDTLINKDTDTEVQEKILTAPIIDTLDAYEETTAGIETEVQTEKIKTIEKEVVKTTNETVISIKKEETAIKDIVEEKVVETEKEIEAVAEPKVEKIIEKEAEIKTVNEPIIEKTKTSIATSNWVVPTKYLSMKNPTDPKVDLSIGKSLYRKHCKSCHGNEGFGDGTKAADLKGDLGDFSSIEFQSQTDGELFFKTTFGRDDMPRYSKKIPNDEDRWLVVNYIRALAE